MVLSNRTLLDTDRLDGWFRRCAVGWPLQDLRVFVRYSRSSPFSGSCRYRTRSITINLGRQVQYPYALKTFVAPARTIVLHGERYWTRPYYLVHLRDGYQLAVFLFMHELYHWLIKLARRNTRQKEGRCDRFAVRALVDHMGCRVVDADGAPVPRETWDFQDLDGFVSAARFPRRRSPARAARKPARPAGLHHSSPSARAAPFTVGRQLPLFDSLERT